MTDVSFVLAMPGWEVLYYNGAGSFETAPIVAWAIHAIDGTFMKATPVTTDLAWTLDDNRVICTPEGDVTCGELERWPTAIAWLDEMIEREKSDPDALPPSRPPAVQQVSEGNAPVVLANYRRRFQQEGD